MRVDNAGTIPVRILADARLLALDLQFDGARRGRDEDGDDDDEPSTHARAGRAVRCELPADMRPSDGDDRSLVLPPNRSYAEKFDPRLFCFGPHDSAAMVTGAKLTPHLIGSRDVAVIEPLDQVEPKVARVQDWPGIPAILGPAPSSPPSKDTPVPDGLAVTTPAFADYGLGWEAEVAVTVTNRASQAAAFLLRPETLVFDVTGPSGVGVTDPSPIVHCAWPGSPPPPIAEAYTRLAPNQSASITILLSAVCPDDTLRRPGLYLVRAKLDTRRASGASIGVHTFVGTVLAPGTTRLRVREWNGAPPPTGRPQLLEQPAQAP